MRTPSSSRSFGGGSVRRSVPSNRMLPAVIRMPAGKMPSTALAMVDLPAPLSPTSAITSPAFT